MMKALLGSVLPKVGHDSAPKHIPTLEEKLQLLGSRGRVHLSFYPKEMHVFPEYATSNWRCRLVKEADSMRAEVEGDKGDTPDMAVDNLIAKMKGPRLLAGAR